MSEKLYPLIIWFYYQNKRRLFTKISFDDSIPENWSIGIARRLAEAIQHIHFDVPIEIALITQSMSTPTAVEVVRVNGVNIHTLEKEAAVFLLTLERENFLILESSNDEIRNLFEKRFSDFRKIHGEKLGEKRANLAQEIQRLDKVCEALSF